MRVHSKGVVGCWLPVPARLTSCHGALPWWLPHALRCAALRCSHDWLAGTGLPGAPPTALPGTGGDGLLPADGSARKFVSTSTPLSFQTKPQVLVEMGSSLQMGAVIHRIQDVALESVALHTVCASMLYARIVSHACASQSLPSPGPPLACGQHGTARSRQPAALAGSGQPFGIHCAHDCLALHRVDMAACLGPAPGRSAPGCCTTMLRGGATWTACLCPSSLGRCRQVRCLARVFGLCVCRGRA